MALRASDIHRIEDYEKTRSKNPVIPVKGRV